LALRRMRLAKLAGASAGILRHRKRNSAQQQGGR